MRLNLNFDRAAWAGQLHFIAQRQYVARTLVPKGFEDYFRQKARYVSAQHSVRIEGNRLSPNDAIQVMVEGPDESIPDEVAAANVSEANDLVAQLASDESLQIDNGIIRALNSVVLRHLPDHGASQRGRYRDNYALIVDSISKEPRYRPPPPLWVPDLMDDLVKSIREWRDLKIDGPILAGLAHFGIISVHPFEDGNGRTARLIADLLLELTDWSVDGMISMSQAIDNYRQEYYDALREAQGLDFQETVEVKPFIDFHLNALSRASVALEEHAAMFGRRLQTWTKLTRDELTERQARGFLYLMDLGVPISSSRYALLTNSSQSSAVSDLNHLAEAGYIARVGTGKMTRYRVAPALEEVLQRSDAAPSSQANSSAEAD